MRKHAVIFDLYGTVADVKVNEESAAFWENLASATFKAREVTGHELRETYHRLLSELGGPSSDGFLLNLVFPKLLAHFGIKPSPDTVREFAESFRKGSIVRLEKMPYTDRLLESLRSYRLGLVSNTEELLTDYDLSRLAMMDRFDAVVLSSRAGAKKPHPRIFTQVLQGLKVSPQEAVFVGDNLVEDVQGANSAHIDAVYLCESKPELQEVEAEPGARILTARFSYESIVSALTALGVEF